MSSQLECLEISRMELKNEASEALIGLMAQIFSRCGESNSLTRLDLSEFTSDPEQARKVLTLLNNGQITGLKSLTISNI